jgi:hypothetical protein
MRRDVAAMDREIAALRTLAEAVREHEREPNGGNVNRMRDALRTVDVAQGRKPAEWDGSGERCPYCRGGAEAHVTGADCPYEGHMETP